MISSAAPVASWPEGRKPGCLPRVTKPGTVFPRLSEQIEIIPSSEWSKYVGASLRGFVTEVLDQDGVGSCATEATAGCMMITRAYHGLPHVALNPWFIYHHTSGGRDNGSSIDDNLQFFMKYGCAPAEVWPRDEGWNRKPSNAAYSAALNFRVQEVFDITTVNEMVTALLKGFAVVYGANGHAVCKVEHLDEKRGLDLNSWGTDWGDGGFGVWASYRSVDFSYGAFAIRV